MTDTLIERLRNENCPSQWHDDIRDCNEERREAADALERAERVVEAAREEAAGQAANETPRVAANLPLVRALAAYDTTRTREEASQ